MPAPRWEDFCVVDCPHAYRNTEDWFVIVGDVYSIESCSSLVIRLLLKCGHCCHWQKLHWWHTLRRLVSRPVQISYVSHVGYTG